MSIFVLVLFVPSVIVDAIELECCLNNGAWKEVWGRGRVWHLSWRARLVRAVWRKWI